MPRKKFRFDRRSDALEPLDIAPNVTVYDALKRVLKLPAVCSKRFLTSKVRTRFWENRFLLLLSGVTKKEQVDVFLIGVRRGYGKKSLLTRRTGRYKRYVLAT
jgi:hypothetical protein